MVERRFVGADEYLQKYKDKKDEGFADYMDYVGRAIPFTIKGGETMAKTLELQKEEGAANVIPFPKQITLGVVVHTASGNFNADENYTCPQQKLPVGSVDYCKRTKVIK